MFVFISQNFELHMILFYDFIEMKFMLQDFELHPILLLFYRLQFHIVVLTYITVETVFS